MYFEPAGGHASSGLGGFHISMSSVVSIVDFEGLPVLKNPVGDAVFGLNNDTVLEIRRGPGEAILL